MLKKFFLHPGFAKNSLWTLFFLLTTVVFRGNHKGLIATNVEDCAILVFVAFGVLQIVARLIQGFIWHTKIKQEPEESSEIFFDKAEKATLKWDIANVFQFIIMLITVIVLGTGYCNITPHCWVSAAFIIISLYDVIKNIVGNSNKKKLFATFVVVSVIIVCCVFGVTQWANAEYDKSLDSRLHSKGLPISVSDLIDTKTDCTDKTLSVKATRFGEHYTFSSKCEEDENTSYYLYYEVLISNYHQVADDYINLLEKRYKKYKSGLIKADETFGWDELYYEVLDGKTSQRGYAVKGNTVVMLDYTDLPEETDFFEKACEKLN